MADPRLIKLAQVITEYSTEIKRGDRVFIAASPIAQPLTLAVIEQVIKRGGLPHMTGGSGHHLDLVPGALELMLKYGSDEQLQYLNPFVKMAIDQFEVRIVIRSDVNIKSLSNVDPRRIVLMTTASGELTETMMRRSAAGALRWVVTQFPTDAAAQDAEMSLSEYEDFVYGAGMLTDPDPVARWQEFRLRQDKYIAWLKGKQRIHVKGPNCDLVVGITDRIFINSCGLRNFPDGEIFTGPEETITEGWVNFTYPLSINSAKCWVPSWNSGRAAW